MSEKTRYSRLLYHAMGKDLQEEFFDSVAEDTDAGWDLFEAVHPEMAESLFSVLEPMLKGIEEDLKFITLHNRLMSEGEELKAARLKVIHKTNKLDW